MNGAVPATLTSKVRQDQGRAPWSTLSCASDPTSNALLSAREERELSDRAKLGDSDARDRLIRSNLRLVVRIASDFQGRGMSLEDLIGEGNLGLTRAADRFDPKFGTKFCTYAAYWIKEAIRSALCNTNTTIRVPAHTFALLSKWRATERALRSQTGLNPSDDEIAEQMGLTGPQKLMVAQGKLARRVSSGDGQADEYCRQHAVVGQSTETPESAAQDEDDRINLKNRLDRLDRMERSVVELRFGLEGGEPLTLMEVGRRLGVTREWVRKIEIRAIQKLR